MLGIILQDRVFSGRGMAPGLVDIVMAGLVDSFRVLLGRTGSNEYVGNNSS